MQFSNRILLIALCLLPWASAAHFTHDILAEAQAQQAWMESIRRHLHTIPEIKYTEAKTSEFLRQQLQALGISYHHPVAQHGIVGQIGTGEAPRIALRADMDALPIQEERNVSYRSTHPGLSHQCGHDAHMAMLLGAAKVLKAREAMLPGTVVLLFQPAEEGGAGAKRMVQQGAMQGVGAVFGLHVWPTAPAGVLQTRAGVIMAATDKFWVTFSGVGGHGGTPHLVRDAVVCGAAAVMNLQPLVSRETDPAQGSIVGVTLINSGPGSPNIHTDWVELQGTINSLSTQGLDQLRARVEAVARSTAGMHRCSVNVTWTPQAYSAVVNDRSMVELVRQTAAGPLKPRIDEFVELERPSFMAEDMAFLNEAAPGVFAFMGIADAEEGTFHKLHTPQFKMLDRQLTVGAALHAAMALGWLETAVHDDPASKVPSRTEL